jgi:hypothetical protein
MTAGLSEDFLGSNGTWLAVLVSLLCMKKADAIKKSNKKKWTIAGCIAAVIVLVAIVAVISASKLSKLEDGTQNFSGIKLAAAQHALVHIRKEYVSEPDGGGGWGFGSKLQVVKVTPTTRFCSGPTTPADIGYYDVTVRQIWLFGIKSETTWDGCVLETDL